MYNYYEILELLNEEFLASVIDTELLIINKIKYYNSSFFRKNLKLSKLDDKIEYIKYPFIYSGLYSNTDKVIIIFLNNCKNSI